MKRILSVTAVIAVLLPKIAGAVDFAFQPRLEGGMMYYKFEQDGFLEDGNATIGLQTIGENGMGKGTFSRTATKFQDTLPFIGGGITMFADKFFVDLKAQYAFDGKDTATTDTSTFVEGENNIGSNFISDHTRQTLSWDTEFERTEFSVSVGYAITELFVAYAGYIRAETDFEHSVTSTFFSSHECTKPATSPANTNISCASVTFDAPSLQLTNRKANSEFEQDGPFIGTTFGYGFNKGRLAGKLAVAFLSGKLKQKTEFIPARSFDGDTVGLSLGINWTGYTPIKTLTYQVGVDGYQYTFKSDNSPNIREEVVKLNLSLNYFFDT